ncbi:MAG TPA: PDZ domain-containing protein [Candidatus Angelobacter sp.]|nr:PDZ domain-containing protein [Candidatus Angelobacter sp.]
MMRTLITALLLGLLAPAAMRQASAAQPEGQPQPGLNPVPGSHFYAAGRSYLGVDIRDVTKDRMEALKLKEERGVEITAVDRDAPAGKAGLREHDVILSFNNTPVASEEQLRRLIRETPPGRNVTLGVSRDGASLNVPVQLADHNQIFGKNRVIEIPDMPAMPEIPDMGNRFDVPGPNIYVLRNTSAILGVQTENLTSQLGDFFGVKNGEGVLVRSVEKGSPAEKGGLKAGDVIVRIGDEKLSDRSDLARLMRKYRNGGKLNLGVVRDKHEQNLSVDLPQRRSRDSSSVYIDNEDFETLLNELDELRPELESDGEIASLELRGELNSAMKSYRDGMSEYGKAMRQYKGQFKDLQKQLEKEQKEFDRYLHPML